MDVTWQKRVREIFLEAVDRPGEERSRVLARECGGDAALRRDVEQLLRESTTGGESPMWAPFARVDLLQEPDRVGSYRIVRELGRGGQGVVYEAFDERLHRRVALKVLRRIGPGNEMSMARFRREAEAASRLDHPGICTVFDAGVADGSPYIAMRLLEGRTLAQEIAAARFDGRSGKRDVSSALDQFERVAAALHSAHEAGIVHRDVKPGNIMITENGSPIVLDFGLARDDESDVTLTHEGQVFGTPCYMSPEQVEPAARVDRRADIFSLAVTLYEVLCGVRPFGGATRHATQHAIANDPPVDIRKHRRLSRDLAAVLEVALAKDPDQRYETAADLAEDLRRVRMGEPILARPPSVITRAWRFASRNPVVVSLTVAVIVALAAGLTTATILNQRLGHAADRLRAENATVTYQAARFAAERGAWDEAIAFYDQALAKGFDQPGAARLGKVTALIGSVRIEEARAELAEIRDVPDDLAGKLLLFKAYLTDQAMQSSASRALYRQAIEVGLSDQDEAFARAMIAGTFEECLDWLKRAHRIDPIHRLANEVLAGVMVVAGPLQEAEAIVTSFGDRYPQDDHLPVLDVYLCARRDGAEAAARRIDEWGDRIEPQYRAGILMASGYLQMFWSEDALEDTLLAGLVPAVKRMLDVSLKLLVGVPVAGMEDLEIPSALCGPAVFIDYLHAWLGLAAGPDSPWVMRAMAAPLVVAFGTQSITVDQALDAFPRDPAFLVAKARQLDDQEQWSLARAHYLAAADYRCGLVTSMGRIALVQAAVCDAKELEQCDETRRPVVLRRSRPVLERLVTRELPRFELWELVASLKTLEHFPDLLLQHAANGAARFGDLPEVELTKLLAMGLQSPRLARATIAEVLALGERRPDLRPRADAIAAALFESADD